MPGRTIMLGTHLIRTYSKTQATIAKSSGESELYAVLKASAEGLGMVMLLSDFGAADLRVSIGMDASAAIGMAQRSGLNKVRHVEVDVFWLQEQMARRPLPIGKIPGPQSPSDLRTKNVPLALLEQASRCGPTAPRRKGAYPGARFPSARYHARGGNWQPGRASSDRRPARYQA